MRNARRVGWKAEPISVQCEEPLLARNRGIIGFVMACVGGYLLSNQVTMVGSYWSFYGSNTFGVTLIPMLLGIALLFSRWNGKSVAGWVLTAGGFLFILAGVIANLHIYFQPTTLFNTLVMLVLLGGGLWLVLRSIAAHDIKDPKSDPST